MRLAVFILFFINRAASSQFAPPAGQPGTTAIHKDSSIIVGWANRVESFQPGPQDISNAGSPLANYGMDYEALGKAEGDGIAIVSLGDKGEITLGFPYPIMNGPGFDFAIFENSFSADFLEFAHVEVSTDGINFVRFPSQCLVDPLVQTNGFGSTNTEQIHNLAGKYKQGYGTPFDLEDLIDSTDVNLDSINFIKIIDVVGSVDSMYGTFDGMGNIINDPFPTPFESSGFDLDAVGIIHVNGVFELGIDIQSVPVMFYPNPTNGKIWFKAMEFDQISIYNSTGQLVFYSDNPELEHIDLTEIGLDEGVYYLRIESERSARSEKVILSRN